MNTISEPLTRSIEDYLKAIYRLSGEGRPAATSVVAQHLGLSPASVSGMVKRLSDMGLLEHEPYRGASLTDDGRRVALRMLRRHRLIEAYLVAHLGYGWDTVHDEAERLEHAVSDELVERMAVALGNPTEDPHGDPIPTADGTLEELVCLPLSELPEGRGAEIRRVREREPEFLRHLAAIGLVPGVRVTVTDRQPFHGPVTIVTDGAERVIGFEMAESLLCLPEDA